MRAAYQELPPTVLGIVARRRLAGLNAGELAQALNRGAIPPIGGWSRERVQVLLDHLDEHGPSVPFPLERIGGVKAPARHGTATADTRGRKVDGRRRR